MTEQYCQSENVKQINRVKNQMKNQWRLMLDRFKSNKCHEIGGKNLDNWQQNQFAHSRDNVITKHMLFAPFCFANVGYKLLFI